MATVTSTASIASPPPLKELTNNSSHDVSPLSSPLGGPSARRKTVRRVRSVKQLHHYHDSSENSLAEQDSIFNASPIESAYTFNMSKLKDKKHPMEINGIDASRSHDLTQLMTLSPVLQPTSPGSHSQWPTPELSTVIERPSRGILRSSTSVPRLRDSPQKISKIIHPQQSIKSIHPSQQADKSQAGAEEIKPQVGHFRSRSLNDLEIARPSGSARHKERSRSSSSDVLANVPIIPPFPKRPVQAPPHRIITPPGLPSFGSQEAQELRLSPTPSYRFASLLSRLLRRSHEDGEGYTPPLTHQNASPPITPSQSTPSLSLEMMRKLLGLDRPARIISPPVHTSDSERRGSLPPGVHKARTAGALTRAEDGTLVRGRFSNRASGHRVGARGISNHPLGRRDQLSAISESVREIDKACEQAERGGTERQDVTVPDSSPPQSIRSQPDDGRHQPESIQRYTYPAARDRLEHLVVPRPRNVRQIQRPAVLDHQSPPLGFQPLSPVEHVRSPPPSIRATSPSERQTLIFAGSRPMSATSMGSTVRSPLSNMRMPVPLDYTRSPIPGGNTMELHRYLREQEIADARQRVMNARAQKQDC